MSLVIVFFFKQKTAYDLRISDWSSDVCSSDLGLPGLSFPAPPKHFPTKDEMADYLEAYVERFDLPVRLRTTVTRVARHGDGYVVETGDVRYLTSAVIVAMAGYQQPCTPAWSDDMAPRHPHIHPPSLGRASLRDRVSPYMYISVLA